MPLGIKPDFTTIRSEDFNDVSPYTLVKMSSYRFTGCLIQYLELLFFSKDNIVLNEVKDNFIWTNDPDTSKIRIESGYSEEVSHAGLFPAIFVHSAGCNKHNSKVIENLNIQTNDPQFSTIPGDYIEFCDGQHLLTVMARTGGEVAALTECIERWFSLFRPNIIHDIKLESFRLTQVQASKWDPKRKVWIVNMAITWQSLQRWSIEDQSSL